MQHESVSLGKLVIGVALGVLLADLVRLAVVAGLAGLALQSVGASFDTPGRITERTAAPARNATLQYHGPNGAYRAGSSRACVDGVMADRAGLGWTTDTRSGRSIPCEATTN